MTALLVIGAWVVVVQFGYIVWLDRRNRQLYTEARRLQDVRDMLQTLAQDRSAAQSKLEGHAAPCNASPARVWWALIQTKWPAEKISHYQLAAEDGRLTLPGARLICAAAGVPLAALYLPDPSRWQLFRAWWRGAAPGYIADRPAQH